jgi:hypothetical protein
MRSAGMPNCAARSTIGGHGQQVRVAAEPFARDRAVEQRLLRAEGLGHHDDGGAPRVEPGEHALRRGAVDVGHEVHAEPARRRRRQGIHDQARAQVGPADADADDVGDRRVLQRFDQDAHARERGGGFGMGRDGDFRCRQVTAQGSVQGRATFGRVDVLAVEQGLQAFGELRRVGEIEQRVQRRAVIALAREIRVDGTDAKRELAGARRIVGDEGAQRHVAQARGMRAQGVEVCGEGIRVHANQSHAACLGIE